MKHALRIVVVQFVLWICSSPCCLTAAPPAPLTDPAELFTRLDRNGDGRIEAAEIEPAHARLFRKLLASADGDRDGALTQAELTAGLKDDRPERPLEKLPDPPSKEEVTRAVFRRLDGNRNGRLELKEVPVPRQPYFKKLLPTADKNDDKALNLEEFAAVYEQLLVETPKTAAAEGNRPDAETVLKRIMQLDANGDGKISAEEARGPVKGRFEKLDADGNGALDKAELQRAAERLSRAAAEPNPEGEKLKERLQELQKKLDKKPTGK